MTESEFQALSQSKKQPRMIFDPTINLGHVLTFVGFIATGFMGYSMLEKRITVVEQAVTYQNRRDEYQDATMRETRLEIKESLRDIHVSLEKIVNKYDERNRK